jgi:hypothetical protein
MSSQKIHLVIVVPTRNRANLAKTAIQSVLSQYVDEETATFELIISDNSTEDDEATELKHFCDALYNSKLIYFSPPQPIPMTKHWNWIMEKLFSEKEFTHVIFLTDRSVLKPRALSEIIQVALKYPEKIIAYSWDSVVDYSIPVSLIQNDWTGKVCEIFSSHALKITSEVSLSIGFIPKMHNCCTPKSVFSKIKETYSVFFDSVSPDYNFAYSALSLEESFIFLDRPLTVDYGFSRSNGNNMGRAVKVKDTEDFLKNTNWNISFKTPIPIIFSLTNAILHEYCFVKNKKLGIVPMPDHNQAVYTESLIRDISGFKNSKIKYLYALEIFKYFGVNGLVLFAKAIFNSVRAKYPIRSMLLKRNNYSPIKFFSTPEEAIKFSFENPKLKNEQPGAIEKRLCVNKEDVDADIIILT